ncbi:N-acetylmuramoyl-L-alanine amidase [Rhodanobacter sp. DHB23]|uniref:N-acetylmuramoyl-L-alanine amidase n=1 Tax=Rhodanobacter sp. DHB23 TaxID=2775923 RepID=UPI001CE10F1C|nr:N-acetylmuramoyl-L-alanine amidase [Rhodanobacter sp. DHB23]
MSPVGAHAADVTAARVWADASHTRLVFDLDAKPDYRIDRRDDQVVVDFTRGRIASGYTDPAAHGLFRGMSRSQQGGGLQLTAKVMAGSKLRSFVLPPGDGGHYRLVLDLLPGAGTDVADAAPAAPAPAAAARPATAPVADDDTGPTPPVVATVSDRRSGRKTIGSSRQVTQQAATLLNGQRKVVVCVDAGHGGKDPGSHGPDGTLEKNVTLAVARDLAAQINRQPGMKAILTRDGDYFIPLARRYQIAREHDADLFVSIHADAFTSGDARGSSVWVLSSRGKSSVAAQMLADHENSSDLIGGVSLDDKSDGLAKVLLDMQQGWAVQASDTVAGNVLKSLAQLGPTHRGYVERANFVVLRSPDVPSILVETAFISNPAEERKLRDPDHQQALASAVMSGVKGYFESTPPPGTWFAAQAARGNGVELASARVGRPADDAATAVADAPAAADAGVRDLHRVGEGESLRSIARQYGISVGALKNANHIDGNVVRTGTMLAIPSG